MLAETLFQSTRGEFYPEKILSSTTLIPVGQTASDDSRVVLEIFDNYRTSINDYPAPHAHHCLFLDLLSHYTRHKKPKSLDSA
ncbi:hypothetical protein VNO80_10243 [Phaseolus coccineus]|uniref:Uncharacterized protein n=1 Tax=Phaseolus coccineus TaxID=3886 RepID=A0AAN9N7R8_PHACN